MSIPYSEYARTDLFLLVVVQFVFMIIVTILVIALVKKYSQNRADVVKSLMFSFLMLNLSALFSWIPKFMNYFEFYEDFIYGIPLGNGLYLWWTNFSYIFNVINAIYLTKFTQQLFKFKNRKILIWEAIFSVIFSIWTIYYGIFVYTPGSSSLNIYMSIILMILTLFPSLYLFIYTHRDVHRLPPSVYRFGYQLIYYGTALSLIAYAFWILTIVLKVPKYFSAISQIINSIVMILMSLGLIFPQRMRDYLKTHYNLPEE